VWAAALALCAGLLPAAATTVSYAGNRTAMDSELVVESRVLAPGATVPPLAALRSPSVRRGFDQEALRSAEGEVPWETVGPARRYARVAGEPSAVAPADIAAAPRPRGRAAGVAYPEPARTLNAQECQQGLGASKKFYIRSRFAVCAGALYHQTWWKNRRPVGESRFVVLVVGTIAPDSREARFQWHFVDMDKTGETHTAGLLLTPHGATPLVKPAQAKPEMGGIVPGRANFDQFRAARTFTHTMTVPPGLGSGPDDLVATVYEPSLQLTFPTGVKGSTGGRVFMLPPRWDTASYLRNSTGGNKPAQRGAATFAVLGNLHYSVRPGAPERAVGQHLRKAFTRPQDTKPYHAGKWVPGQNAQSPLNRLFRNAQRKAANRNTAVAQCRKNFGTHYAAGGNECDEYPFASTYQGAAESNYTKAAPKLNFSVQPLPRADNGNAGALLLGFYAKNRLLDGPDDAFTVTVTN
jgi:hypothetical protein